MVAEPPFRRLTQMDSGYYDDYQYQEDMDEATHADALAASEEALLRGRSFSNKVPSIFN